MIKPISISSVNRDKTSQNDPRFKGLLEVAVSGLQACEANPMLNVTVLDLLTAIAPRTFIEGQTNPYAGLEAFRRESSGLIINCLIPGVIVAGVAKLIQGQMMGGKTQMASCWANEDTINLVTDYWNKAKGSNNEEKIKDTIRKILNDTKGVDGDELKSFAGIDFEASIDTLAKKSSKDEVNKAIKAIVEKTHISENIRIARQKGEGHFSQSLKDVLENAPKILRELIAGKNPDTFAQKATRLVTAKSVAGLGIIIPLAIMAQPINRWITAKTSGKKGAPIYKDFEHSDEKQLSSKEKAALTRQKFISVGSMVGIALLSIMKMPSIAMLKGIAQFKGIFPSMDQARIISTATFASRMAASEDKNDLRESTVRDIATFSAFYFLGDYVAKGIATVIQKTKGIKLINVLKETPKDANFLKKSWYWAKHTALKSSDEVYGATEALTKQAKTIRGACQLGNIAFSLVALGLVIPKMYRNKTDKAREKELKDMGVDKKIIDKYYPAFEMSMKGKTPRKTLNSFAACKN